MEEIPNCGKEDFSITSAAAAEDEAEEEEEDAEGGYTGQNLQFEPRAKRPPNRTDGHAPIITRQSVSQSVEPYLE